MPKFVIERELPGAGKLSPEDLKTISQKSCSAIDAIGTSIQWVQSYVTDNKIYCVYVAANADLIKQHAKEGGFPANAICQVRNEISPVSAE